MYSRSPEDPLVVALRDYAPHSAQLESHLASALTQTTNTTGKLVRARLAHEAAREHGLDPTSSLQLACAVEYYHTASLLLDDLPCMDDAKLRRGLPCVHVLHGDATAILGSLALINRAYALLGFAFAEQPASVRWQMQACVDACLGTGGLVGGQAADLRFGQSRRDAREVSRIAMAKTGSLFWLAVFVPALLAHPGPEEQHELKSLCIYWGLVFQGLDDLADVQTSSAETGKSSGRDRALTRPNLVHVLGEIGARQRIARLGSLAASACARLVTWNARWDYLRRFHEFGFTATSRRVLTSERLAA